jgi:hypothetical protein
VAVTGHGVDDRPPAGGCRGAPFVASSTVLRTPWLRKAGVGPPARCCWGLRAAVQGSLGFGRSRSPWKISVLMKIDPNL